MKLAASVTTAMLLLGLAAPAEAFRISGIGAKLGYVEPQNIDGTAVFSVHTEFERPETRVHLQPSMTLWSSEGVRNLLLSSDAYYHFGSQATVSPYLGAGFGLHFLSTERAGRSRANDVDPGLNLFGGLRFPAERTTFIVEGRFGITRVDQASLLAGLTYSLRH